jgi:hypothetical protein
MKVRDMAAWQFLYNQALNSIGMTLEEMYRNGQTIEERRQLHPYPHELCFCLPGDIPYEKTGIILRLLIEIKRGNDILVNYGNNTAEEKLAVAHILSTATPVLWNYDLLKISTSGADAFIGTEFDPSAFNPPTQLWIPDRDLVLKNHEAEDLGLDPSRKWNQVGFVLMIPEGTIPVILREASGVSFPRLAAFMIFQTLDPGLGGVKYLLHLLRDDVVDKGCCEMIASAEFMHQSIVEVVKHRPRREERRRAEKSGKKPPAPFYQVKLRRREGARTEGGHEAQWSRRWIVWAHWRKQWYPSRNGHKPILIHSYVKGPEDLPLVMAKEKIVTVRR